MTTATSEERTQHELGAVLLDAHSRGRAILESAVRRLREGASDDAAAGVAAPIHRFVTFINPLHELDEERMVVPALRAHGPKEEVDAALAHVVDEHVAFDALRDKLGVLWKRVMDAPASVHSQREELLVLTEDFARAHDRHMAHEEHVIFPLVQKYVPSDVQARILAVLSRRDVDA
jgi:iron-sulfur cluster repair protein YtfE (RIC family)